MNRVKTIAFFLLIGLIPTALNAAPEVFKTTEYLGYNWQTGLNDLPQTILYQVPDPRRFGAGPYPVFVWTPGTYEWFLDVLSVNFVSQMAARGFVSASVQYHNFNPIQLCP